MTKKHETRDVCAGESMNTSIISIRHLCKEYLNVTPLKDVSVEIKKGEVISIIGPSGTGKSTLLRCINLLETPTKGEIVVDGVVTTDKKCKVNLVRQKMGMVFQSFNLFAHKTIIENIMMGQVDLLGRSRQEAYDRGMELLRNIGLADKAFSYPDELSGDRSSVRLLQGRWPWSRKLFFLTSRLPPWILLWWGKFFRLSAGWQSRE